MLRLSSLPSQPAIETRSLFGSQRLTQIDEQIDETLVGWTTAILTNLDDPITHANLDLLKADDRAAIDDFLQSKTPPVPLDNHFVHAFAGSASRSDQSDGAHPELHSVLHHGPATPEELRDDLMTILTNSPKAKTAPKCGW
ncbi:MAG: DUF6079 family protein [Caldilineaceae bacterium]